MPTIAEVRQKYPQYQDMSDSDLAGALHKKYYSDMPVEQFNAKIGLSSEPAAPKTDRLPESRGFMRRVDDAVRGIADTATFGFADEIAAGLGSLTGVGSAGGNYDQNLSAERQRDSQGGWERVGGQVVGAFTNPAMSAKTVLGAAGQGAAAGAAYGFGSGEGSFENRRDSAIMGGAVGAAAGGALKSVANRLGNRAAAKTIPSNDQIRKQAEAAYNKAEAAGVVFKPEGVRQLAGTIVNDLAEFGFDPALQPGAAAVIRRFQELDGKNVTLKGLDIVRRVANNAAKVVDNPSQQEISRRIIERIDDYIENVTDADVLMGNAKQGASAMREARDAWGRFRRSQMVDTAAYKAELRAASTGSGGNMQNATKQNIRRLVEKPRGMSKQEQAAAERVVMGSRGENAARLVGKLAPTGAISGGIGTSAGAAIGSAVGGVPGAAIEAFALPAVGQVAKMTADRLTLKNVERLSQIIRSGGKTAQDLGNLARKGQLDVAGVKRVENVAKSLGLSVPELAAVMEQNLAN